MVKCNKCSKNIKKEEKAYLNGKIVCQDCFVRKKENSSYKPLFSRLLHLKQKEKKANAKLPKKKKKKVSYNQPVGKIEAILLIVLGIIFLPTPILPGSIMILIGLRQLKRSLGK